MLIDLQANDSNELSEWVRDNPGLAPINDVIDNRINRFRKAFSYIFEDLDYKKIITVNEQKDVIFTLQNKEVSISSLSSGEKQIVFRGGFLLKDKQSTEGCTILIDEPEISLHPNWQKKYSVITENYFMILILIKLHKYLLLFCFMILYTENFKRQWEYLCKGNAFK